MTFSLDKQCLYDWFGANEQIFKTINSIQGNSYDMVMILLSRIADAHKFPYYFGALAAWAFITHIIRKINTGDGKKLSLHLWIGILAVLATGFATEAVTIKMMKEHFSYPRPYAVFEVKDIHVLEYRLDPEDAHHSFPSGHALFITLMVVGLWPVLTRNLRWSGILLIAGAGWSRIALGMHFPADVAGGVALGLFITLLVRLIVYKLLRKFHVQC
jgi:membrane-associated phospholipid phosphatase